jgi:exopolysaccharide biosynthesis polyprenyl glycosylphosphotransferase
VEGDTTLEELVAMFDGATTATGVQVLGNLDDLETVLAAEAIDTVVVAVRRNRLQLFSRLSAYKGGDITVQELPAFSEHVFGRVPVDVINAAWFMHMIHPFYRPYSRIAKRLADLAASIVLGLVALPMVPFVIAAVRLTSPGAALYSQIRVGEQGREFRIYKFRTMRIDAEANGAQWASHNDPRITRLGAMMRSTRLDEIPQLWNVLRGHMSFVGPRPERPQFVEELEAVVPYYQRRHMVKPGLTGWAQVRLSYTDSVDGAANKLGYELYYLKHQSLFLDFVIFVETIRVVLLRFGSR